MGNLCKNFAMSRWSRRLRLAAFLIALVYAASAPADTIILKNGRRIRALSVREQGARVIYETESGEYSLPRTMVASIEKDSWTGTTAGPSAAQGPEKQAVEIPAAPARVTTTPIMLLPGGEIDREHLNSRLRSVPADEAGRARLASELVAAIDYEMQRNGADAAAAISRSAVSAIPGNADLMLVHGILLLHQQQVQLAREWLLRARAAAPDSAAAWKFSGYADYLSDRTEEAIRAWRKAMSLAPDAALQRMLERAEREIKAESHHQQAASGHFVLRFEGGQVSPDFGRQILQVLEQFYLEMDRWFDARLREPIPVILYTTEAFRDVTRAPSWAGAVNDGRLRIPVQGLAGMTPDLARVLRHELAHSFVVAKARRNCPTWLNEGIAQYLEGQRTGGNTRLRQAWAAGARLPWQALEQSFMALDPRTASLAYVQSLAAVEALAARYGMHEVVRTLALLAAGHAPEAALRQVYGLNYDGLTAAVGAFVDTR